MTIKALIVVDVQNDFCEGGALPVTGGAAVAAAITSRLREHPREWDHVVATRDHHVDPGEHFSDRPNFATTWPPHCVAGTPGGDFHPQLDTASLEAVFDKGDHSAAYSGFEGYAGDESHRQDLASWLRERGVSHVDVVGIATDHCVLATALDAASAGFHTTVLLDLTAGVAPDSTRAAMSRLREAGVDLEGTPKGGLPVG